MTYTGSKWHKWDLHVHTPLSIEQNYGGNTASVWEEFLLDLEALPSYYKVLGINDYFTIEGYQKLANFQEIDGRLKDRVLLPVIELRIKAFGNLNNKDAWSRVNLHVIFNNNNIPDIQTQFLNQLDFDYVNFHKKGLTIENLKEFGEFIINETPENKKITESPLKVGFHNLNFDHRKVEKILKSSGLDYFIAIGKAELSDLRWDGSAAEKRDVVNRSHFIFSASPNTETFKIGVAKLKEEGILQPLIHCSDAHTFSFKTDSSKLPINTRIGNCFSWIKAEPTFEGLKQIRYETDTRLFTSEQEPVVPLLKINNIILDFPEDVKISRSDSKEKAFDFCLRGKQTISFNPYFTCLIGGRGTGKSTLLNLLAKVFNIDDSFFKENILINGSKDSIKIEQYVTVDASTSDFEFIKQNQIESYAEKGELTDTIYSRLNALDLDILEANILNAQLDIDVQIQNIKEKSYKESEIQNLNKDLDNFRKIVDTFDRPIYKDLASEIQILKYSIDAADKSKSRFNSLLSNLKEIIEKYQELDAENQYDEELLGITKDIKVRISKNVDFALFENAINKYEEELLNKQGELGSYLREHGLSPDNIAEYEKAVSQVPILTNKIKEIELELSDVENAIAKFVDTSKDFEIYKSEIEQRIVSTLDELNAGLIIKNVSDIRFEYLFDIEKAKDSIFREFEKYFDFISSKENTKRDSVKECLFCVDPELVDNFEIYCEELLKKSDSNAKVYIQKIFQNEANFEIYKIIIKRAFIDVNAFKKIEGYYGGKELKSCSFGQRCTAIIVALLMFGNKPLLIDEPEAHLDSKLIAEYLVSLIKKRKSERQIIFATHNANFVINGDAELIQILEIDEKNNKTIFTPTTIENLHHRDKLLSLEGGKDAFERRDKKLIKRK